MSAIRFSTALLLAVLAPAGASAQATTTYKATTGTTTNNCSGDKIQLTGFSLSPSTPSYNQAVTVKVDLKNLCGETLSIPYKVADGSTVVTSGTKSVAANQTATVQYTWTATAGSHSFDAILDSGNSLNETSTVRANNGASSLVTFTVAAPVLETKLLSFESAQQVGATSNHVVEGATGCTHNKLMVGGTAASFFAYMFGVPPCGSATFEAFTGFSLKNGWKVKSSELSVGQTAHPQDGTWEWVTRPAVGSTSPTAKVRIKRYGSTLPMDVFLTIKIYVEGPAGTSPY